VERIGTKQGETEKFPSELILDLYANLMAEIWEIVSALIGGAILELLLASAVRKTGEKYIFLKSLKISEEGVSLDGVRKDCRNMAPGEIHRGFQNLINHLSHLFSALTENVISKELLPKVLPRVREAERMISQK
jgi:hypothetical protein